MLVIGKKTVIFKMLDGMKIKKRCNEIIEAKAIDQ